MTRSFCISVLLPLAAILAAILIVGCEQPVAPRPIPVPSPSPSPSPMPCPCHQLKVVAFGAEWCVACRNGMVKLVELQQRVGVKIEYIDIDQHPDVVTAQGITSISLYIVIRMGHPIVRTQNVDTVVRLVDEVYGRR